MPALSFGPCCQGTCVLEWGTKLTGSSNEEQLLTELYGRTVDVSSIQERKRFGNSLHEGRVVRWEELQ